MPTIPNECVPAPPKARKKGWFHKGSRQRLHGPRGGYDSREQLQSMDNWPLRGSYPCQKTQLQDWIGGPGIIVFSSFLSLLPSVFCLAHTWSA